MSCRIPQNHLTCFWRFDELPFLSTLGTGDDYFLDTEKAFRAEGELCLHRFEGVVSDRTVPRHLTPIDCPVLGTDLGITSHVQAGEPRMAVGTRVSFFLGIYELGLRALGVQSVEPD
eukprot:m.269136 g.269136  ORF g.269136 m.269136 type:complete len:117 (-) comp36647_c0_seq1:3-353(-)